VETEKSGSNRERSRRKKSHHKGSHRERWEGEKSHRSRRHREKSHHDESRKSLHDAKMKDMEDKYTRILRRMNGEDPELMAWDMLEDENLLFIEWVKAYPMPDKFKMPRDREVRRKRRSTGSSGSLQRTYHSAWYSGRDCMQSLPIDIKRSVEGLVH
jgi:hypothetical protein